MKKILIIFLTFFIVSCGNNVKNNSEKIFENKENPKNISQESEWEINISDNFLKDEEMK